MSKQVRTFIVSEIRNRLSVITLNRPLQLNAFFPPLIDEVLLEMTFWRKHVDKLSSVLIKGAGDKAFSAGGDVKFLLQAFKERNLGMISLQTQGEYSLVHRLETYSIPTVALVDGICMGTGGGIFQHSSFSVVSERAIFAMPETAIGIVPDSGVALPFGRLDHKLGVYLGLTGARLKGASIYHAGLSDFFVSSEYHEALETALESAETKEAVKGILKEFHEKSRDRQTPFSLEPHLSEIENSFSHSTVEQCMESLSQSSTQFARETKSTLEKMSPTALKATLRHINTPYKTLLECLSMDYRVIYRLCRSHDFIEGVSALLVDKDREPKWRPASLSEVTDEQIDSLFQRLPTEDEFEPIVER